MTVLPFRRKQRAYEARQQGLVLDDDWHRPSVKWGLGTAHVLLLVLLVIVGLGPILWLFKSAITTTQDTIVSPMALFPHGIAWSNLTDACI
jgi:multiple sugar transport system permease protein